METKSAALLKFWTDPSPSWLGPYIRVEWQRPDGVQESTFGRFSDSDNEINWQYGEPPSRYEDICLEAARYGSEYAVSGAEHVGSETFAEMDAACAFRCGACGVVQASIDDLSDCGRCSKCWVRKMGAA